MLPHDLPHQHGEKNIGSLRAELSRPDRFLATAEIFKQLCDPVRLQIFWLLCHQEACVINVAALMKMSSPAVSHHLRSLQESGLITSRREGREVRYKAAETETCQLLHRTAEQIMAIACPEKAVDPGLSGEAMIRAVHDYLLEHLADRITIADLSRQFLINPTSLKKSFKETYGMSLAAHMKQHRLERAAAMLSETDRSIGQIAADVGYESQSRFTAAFQAYYGMLPTAYRKHPAPPEL